MIDKPSILRLLRDAAKRPLRPKEIAQALGADRDGEAKLKRLLRELEENGAVYRVRKGRYAVPERINLVVGRLQVTRGGQGFVVPEEGKVDVFVPAARLGNAYDGDRVVARIERRRQGRNPEGSIVKILERARTQVVGLFHRSGKLGFLTPNERTLHRDVIIPREADLGAREGDVAVARIVDWGSEHLDPVGEIVEVLGRPGEPGVDVLAIVHDHELPTSFPPGVLAEAEQLGRRRPGDADLDGREDFRDILTFTIDPADARDHDDALSIHPLEGGRWRVTIHIADVSHYVRERSALDTEAFQRGTSVYLVDRVLPMLPDTLSGDLCSLKPGEDRLTLSLSLEMEASGTVLAFDISAGIIRSRYALSYEQAQEIVDGARSTEQDVKAALINLRDLARTLRAARQARGGLDFDLPEARVIINAAGEPTHIQRTLRLETHQLIEEFMILANETIAQQARRRKLPFIYRVHEAPDPDRMERLREFVAGLGLKIARDAHRSPKALQKVLKQVEGQPMEAIISTLVLRSMKQARYSAELEKHFGLGSNAYTHFTSPIRRYPDLVVHRIVRTALLEKHPVSPSLAERLDDIARQASLLERRATEAERDSVELKKLEYMERHLGEEFEGTVNGVTSFGLFVLLDDVLADGLIHMSQLHDDYYHHVEEEFALVGESGKRRFRLGDRLRVRVVSVDREARKLDLGLAG